MIKWPIDSTAGNSGPSKGHLSGVVVVERLSVDQGISVLQEVPHPELIGVHPELGGHVVHQVLHHVVALLSSQLV